VIVAGTVAVRAGLPEAGDAGIDQRRVHRAQIIVGKAEARHLPRLEVFDHDLAA
jgi:hypothetical protein